MRALVVDDDYVSRTKLKALLSAYGDCDAAPDALLALKMFEKAHEPTVPYELITMNIEMPGMCGQEAVQKIREWEHAEKADEVKILMVTASTDPENIRSSFREGCEWYLVKPVTPENLRDALGRLGFSQAS